MSERILTMDEALALLMQSARPVTETEMLPLEAAAGRTLAVPLVSGIDVPPLDNSAMDGYALNTADWAEGRWFEVTQRIAAGSAGQPLGHGEVRASSPVRPFPRVLTPWPCRKTVNPMGRG